MLACRSRSKTAIALHTCTQVPANAVWSLEQRRLKGGSARLSFAQSTRVCSAFSLHPRLVTARCESHLENQTRVPILQNHTMPNSVQTTPPQKNHPSHNPF